MKTPLLLIAAFAVCLTAPAKANDSSSIPLIKTNSGKTYTNCRIFKTDPDGVIIRHEKGGAKLLFADLPEETRTKLGYDAKKAEQYEKDRAEQKKKEREELWKYRNEVAKAQAAAYTAEARRLEVLALQNLAAGGFGGYYGGFGYTLDGFPALAYGVGNGYGYGIGHGFGHGKGFGFDGGFHRWLSNRFGFSPLHAALHRHGRTTLPTPVGSGGLNVIGHRGFAPQRCAVPLATPAMGRLTPPLGGLGR
jgi:hypothetical protein